MSAHGDLVAAFVAQLGRAGTILPANRLAATQTFMQQAWLTDQALVSLINSTRVFVQQLDRLREAKVAIRIGPNVLGSGVDLRPPYAWTIAVSSGGELNSVADVDRFLAALADGGLPRQ